MKPVCGGIQQILEAHAELRHLCDQLEAIADRLPAARPDEIARVASKLEELAAYHCVELNILDAVLIGTEFGQLWASLRPRIVVHHHESENLCIDILEALDCRDPVGCVQDANVAGYMLRCFFEGYRRIILIEELVLFGLARDRLERTEHGALVQCLALFDRSGHRSLRPHL